MKRKIDHIDLNKHLTSQELLDYNSGVLGSEEMYRIELHLNECEFCSDALEGISQIQQPTKLINAINESIKPQRQTIQLPRNYLAIAASIILIAAIGFTFWMVKPFDEDKSLAVNTLDELQKEEKTQAKSLGKNSSDKADFSEEIRDIPEEEEVTNQVSTSKEEQKLSLPPVETSKPALNNVASEQNTTDQATEPQKVLMDANLDVEATDIGGKNEVIAEDTNERMEAPIGTQEQVPIQTMRAKKAAAQSIIEPVEDRNKPEPVNGMSNYKSYLENDLVYPEAATENKVKGNVVLDITIAPNGTIKNISVVKGLGYGCDEEAKRLVLTGPQWLPAVADGTPLEAHIEIKVRFRP